VEVEADQGELWVVLSLARSPLPTPSPVTVGSAQVPPPLWWCKKPTLNSLDPSRDRLDYFGSSLWPGGAPSVRSFLYKVLCRGFPRPGRAVLGGRNRRTELNLRLVVLPQATAGVD